MWIIKDVAREKSTNCKPPKILVSKTIIMEEQGINETSTILKYIKQTNSVILAVCVTSCSKFGNYTIQIPNGETSIHNPSETWRVNSKSIMPVHLYPFWHETRRPVSWLQAYFARITTDSSTCNLWAIIQGIRSEAGRRRRVRMSRACMTSRARVSEWQGRREAITFGFYRSVILSYALLEGLMTSGGLRTPPS